MTVGRNVARAIDALRRGWPVIIDELAVLAVETADEAGLAAFDTPAAADILIAGNRAVTLKLANQRDAVPTGPVRIARMPWIDLAGATAIADPARDLSTPLKGPFQTLPVPAPATAALRLAKMAGLLPALFAGGTPGDDAISVGADAIGVVHDRPALTIASRARLPIAEAEKAEIIAFRAEGDASEHVALMIGEPTGQPPLVRIHSECLTGDVLGSLKCDCGLQLADAIAAIAASGWGILLYLRQEGRGIGLVNKLRAYALQDQGFDTVDANLRLGFSDDERDFGVAAFMLGLLAQPEVRLLTNNPRKVAALEAAGVRVRERVPLQAGANPHNRAYLDTKRDRSGHSL
ncbi:GTP cyclohydrolase II [Sphingosinicella rhizophila]|uniref:GTP cyclohydrolase-2 n=1 Tax=Sphingosinicella rhizophila TaxID=3050082 RepID=A0ABU3Q839_9SPHN|nr:GTP cyclohydrolase II [Sphingosinicella sp. GR2756]MDT9599571.1 GTP cyclohydrolase II [Sphingosinicella sp. GR2756]